jgi:hypothetical protein
LHFQLNATGNAGQSSASVNVLGNLIVLPIECDRRVDDCFFPQNKNFGGGAPVGAFSVHSNQTIAIFQKQMMNLVTIEHALHELHLT